ncbi:MAG: hypothetical protein H8E85_01110 [Candidatus Marinimicrobia bacterium]|nr:hypothetical protein [Candidatus Neomarinimicrobiota bacterium]
MKKLIQSFLPIFILSSQVFAIAGFGLNLNQSQFSVDANTSSLDNFGSYGYDEFSGGVGAGGYLYIDAVPFVDLDLEFSAIRTNYDYLLTIGNDTKSYSVPYGSLAGYVTLQKKVFKLSIPLLAKAKLTVGAGINSQTYKSIPDKSDLEGLNVTGSSSEMPTLDKLVDFINENTKSNSGIHFQAGVQFKLLMLDSFLYYRQVIVDDVIPGAKGFGSLNLRLGMGF